MSCFTLKIVQVKNYWNVFPFLHITRLKSTHTLWNIFYCKLLWRKEPLLTNTHKQDVVWVYQSLILSFLSLLHLFCMFVSHCYKIWNLTNNLIVIYIKIKSSVAKYDKKKMWLVSSELIIQNFPQSYLHVYVRCLHILFQGTNTGWKALGTF